MISPHWRYRRKESLPHRERIRIPPFQHPAFWGLKELPTPHTSGNDAMNKALQQISCSSFSKVIESTNMPRRFTRPTFTIYDGKTYPVEHVSHYN